MRIKETALITGVTGQDGSYMADLLQDKGYRVIGLLRPTTNYHNPNIQHLVGKIEFTYGDLSDPLSLDLVMAEYKPQQVYNFAAQSLPAFSWRFPVETQSITALGVLYMLEAVRKHSPEARFYQASSREIFGGVNEPVFNEDTRFLPNNPYGIAKLYGHLMVRHYREAHRLFSVAGILFNHESPRRSIHTIMRKISLGAASIKLGINNPILNEQGKPLVQDNKIAIGNFEAQRDWGYAPEYVTAAWLMLQNGEPKDYVIATNTIHSVREVCKIAFEHLGLNWEEHVVSSDNLRRPTEITPARGDFSKAKNELGWQPQTPFRDLIGIMVDADLHRLKTGSL